MSPTQAEQPVTVVTKYGPRRPPRTSRATKRGTEYDQLPGPTILQLLYYSERILRIPMIMDTGRQARTEVWPCTSSSDKVITDKVFPPVLHQGRAQGVEPWHPLETLTTGRRISPSRISASSTAMSSTRSGTSASCSTSTSPSEQGPRAFLRLWPIQVIFSAFTAALLEGFALRSYKKRLLTATITTTKLFSATSTSRISASSTAMSSTRSGTLTSCSILYESLRAGAQSISATLAHPSDF